MRIRHLLAFLFFLFLFTFSLAQPMKPAAPALRERLMKYAADNHLYPGGMYMYWDSVAKKPVRFSPKDLLVEDVAQPPAPSLPATTSRVLTGGSFHLVKDINSVTNANPSNVNSTLPSASFAVLGNVSYFSADDGLHGYELWRSDGTSAGTYMVKDINKGETASQPQNMITSGNQLFFIVDNGNGSSLWKSDGTEAGTQEVLNTAGKKAYFYYPTLCNVNGEVYFALSTVSSTNNQLWKTDGTAKGTMLVKDFGTTGYLLHNLVSANGLLFFVAATDAYGAEVWRSDGTESGTFILDDINPSSNIYDSNGPSQLTAYNNRLYFAANDGTGNKLWVTDGTPEGTSYANGYNNILLWNYSYYAFGVNVSFTISNNVMYFMGNQPATGWELYKYDAASGEGITLIKDIVPGTEGISIPPARITDVDGTVYFTPLNNDGNGYTLYKTNGTAASTVIVKQLQNAVNYYNLTNGNGKLYFISSDPVNGTEPWISDGTEKGTVLLKDIYKGSVSSSPDYFTACNGSVLFHASDSVHGSELWASNGIQTTLVTDINTTSTPSAIPSQITPFKDGVLLTAYTYDKGIELWSASRQDASFVWENIAGQRSSLKRNFIVKNDVAYFITDNGEQAYFIYKTDGTTAGTVPVVSANEQIISFTLTDDGTLFYIKNNISGGQQLWKNNGTPDDNTLLLNSQGFLYDIANSYGDYKILTPLGNTVYFAAQDPVTATELWKSDGTVAGTQLVKDIIPGTAGSSPQEITVFKDELYFRAWDGNETGLWKSDGTALGTSKLKGVYPYDFTESNGTLFFAGGSNATGQELWKTDGTPEGTMLMKDILSGSGSSSPASLTDVGGTLFFTASDSTHDNQIWKSDGTKAGTQLVKDIAPLTDDVYIKNLTSAAGKLFFTDIKGAVWSSDGTNTGTGIITDNVLNGLSAGFLTANGNQLFLTGQTYLYGNELYEGDALLVVLPVTLTAFTALLQDADIITQWQTVSETNTSYFNIQRSTDGAHFTDIGKVSAKGSSSKYSIPDVNIANLVSAKTIYYRLQIVDKDGSTSYSKVVPVDLNLKDVIVLLLPNPVKDVLRIRINNYTGKAAISIYDVSGEKISSLQQLVQTGVNITINTTSLQAGVYIAKINLNGKIIEKKFVKE